MGPVRHHHLINWLSMAVALQLSVALVALSARAGRDISPGAQTEAGKAKITVDPACLGNPEAFSYRAALYYDTNPSDANADAVTDAAPNGGWSSSIARPS